MPLDDFNRADETPLSNGGVWSGAVDWFGRTLHRLKVASNLAAPADAGNYCSEYTAAASAAADSWAQAKFTGGGVGDDWYLLVRGAGAGTAGVNGYTLRLDLTSIAVLLYRVDAGTSTQIGGVSTSWSVNDVFRIDATGSTITALKNGSSVTSATDSTYSAAGKVGLMLYGGATADDFDCSALVGGGGTKAITPSGINATSTFSGSVSKRAAIAAGLINATAAVSGNVRALKRISPGQISATAVVSGSVRALRRVAPGQISATSVLSGALAVRRALRLGVINAVATFSGTIVKAGQRLLTGGVINATATVSATIATRRRVLPAQISATSTLSAGVSTRRAVLPAIISATSVVSGTVRRARNIAAGQILATSTITASVGARRPVQIGRIDAVAIITSTVSISRRFVVSGISAFSTITGAVFAPSAVPVGTIGTGSIARTGVGSINHGGGGRIVRTTKIRI